MASSGSLGLMNKLVPFARL